MALRLRKRLLLPAALCLGTALPTPAKAQFLYNAELDARTKAAIEEYEASKKAHLAFIDERLAEIDRQQAALATQAVKTAIAERDADISESLGEDERKGSVGRLRGKLRARIDNIVPDVTTNPGSANYPALVTLLEELERGGRDPLAPLPSELKASIELMQARFRTAKRKPVGGLPNAPTQEKWTAAWYCKNLYLPAADNNADSFRQRVLVTESGFGEGPSRAVQSLSNDHCEDIVEHSFAPPLTQFSNPRVREAVRALGGWAAEDDAEGKPAAGALQDPSPTLRMGAQMTDVARRTRALRQELADSEKVAKALRNEREKLLELWNTNQRASQLKLVACIIEAIVSDGDATKCTGFKEADPDGTNARDLATFAQVRGALSELTSLGSELETLKQYSVFGIVQYLSDPAALRQKAEANCNPAANENGAAEALTDEQKKERQDTLSLCVTDAVVTGINLVERTGKIRDGVPGKISALAVTLAEAQMKSTQIRLRAAALARRAANLEGRRSALMSELQSLVPALADVSSGATPTPARLDRAVFRLGESVRLGQADYARLSAEYGFIGQREFAERERAIASARYDISDALLSTLSASSQAGIRPADIAALLSAGGVTALGIKEIVE